MYLHWIDWTVVGLLLSSLVALTFYVRPHVRSVADFLAANRMAGRYLLAVSGGFGGAISIIALWEMVYKAGLPTQWWSLMSIPVGLFISLTGFVIFRFRQTRALTLAQFFEMRYSRAFRFYAGSLCWLAGIFNYGIFPAVTARFIIYFFGLPQEVMLFGFSIPMLAIVMLCYLSIALFIACAGGQVSIILTDFFQGILLMLVFLFLMFYLLYSFSWNDIMAGMQIAPANQSMINPFKTSQVADFNVWFFLIGVFSAILNTRAWQGTSGYNASAKTPHEAVMAGIIGGWRTIASGLCMLLIPMVAYAVLHLPAFSALAAPIHAEIAKISDPMIQSQMTVPIFLTHTLPIGVMGMFAAVIIACAISCDDTYMHAWGTIFIQDVYMPLRNKPIEPKRHMLILRLSICGVGAFGFVFSLLFPLKDFIMMYFALTGAIYLGGAGSVILGGLYWKRGTTAAAWTSLTVGTILAFGGILIQQLWPNYLGPALLQIWPDSAWLIANKAKFPVNGQIIFFIAMITSLTSYIMVSLLGPKRVYDMDKLLHRGNYAVAKDFVAKDEIKSLNAGINWHKVIGISQAFTAFDKFIAWATFVKSMAFWFLFIIGTVLCLTTDWITDAIWCEIWWWKLVAFSVVLGTVCTLWLAIGGVRDAISLFRDLATEKIDERDDGFVSEKEKENIIKEASDK
ncbi:MAG: sodium:solute symporter family protein [Victivallaceae bacterium]